MRAVFVTGTDTGVGKTVVTGLLARYLLDRGYSAITQKWVQTGSQGFPTDIAEHLKLMGKTREDIESYLPHIVPYTFRLPASPHLAAASEKKRIEAAKIKDSFLRLSNEFDFVVVEGIGGALVPFNSKELVIDIARQLTLPVIIVAENRLGAINHTLLTTEAVRARGMKILGIVFNSQGIKEDKIILEDNPEIIEALTGEKILGNLPRLKRRRTLRSAFTLIGDSILAELTGQTQNE